MQPPFEELRMSNAQSRLLPTTPGFELSDTQFEYFKRRKDRNVGFPGSECYQSCHKRPGECPNFCAEEGFWTGSCCKFGASGDQQAEVCEGRGCIGFHCCVADSLTSEEDQDKWGKRAVTGNRANQGKWGKWGKWGKRSEWAAAGKSRKSGQVGQAGGNGKS